MTTLRYDGNQLHVDNDRRKAKMTPEQFYMRVLDFDLHETAVKAIALQGEPVLVPNTSNARGLRPSAARKYFMQ